MNPGSPHLAQGISVRRARHDGDSHLQTNIDVTTLAGLRLEILTDRALDIGAATFNGRPIAWIAARGFRHPLDLRQNIWSERFAGGLVATCGLDNVGPPCVDAGAYFSQHGQIGGQPADDVRTRWRVLQGRRFVVVTGRIRQPGSALDLRRAIIVSDDAPVLRLLDTVINQGDTSEPVMIQYHCNFGPSVVAPGGSVEIPDALTTPRDAAAAEALDTWPVIAPPRPGEHERVLCHEQAGSGWVSAFLRSPAREGDASRVVCLRYDRRTLPWLWQWRLLSTDAYVIALEPANCAVKPRTEARWQDRLPALAARERVTFRLEIGLRGRRRDAGA